MVPVFRLLWLLVSKLRSAVCYSMLQLVAMRCSVLQCVVVFCYTSIQTAMVASMKSQVCCVLQCVVLCCSVLCCVAVPVIRLLGLIVWSFWSLLLQCVAVCCAVLRYW